MSYSPESSGKLNILHLLKLSVRLINHFPDQCQVDLLHLIMHLYCSLKLTVLFLSHLPYLDRESQVLERQVRLIWAHLSERKIESQNFRDL